MGLALPIVLLVLAVVAFFLEAFVPSGGLIAVVGLGCVVAAIVIGFARGGTGAGVVFIGLSLVLVPAALIAAFAFLPKTRLGRRLALQAAERSEAGYVVQDESQRELVGRTGVALSALRPAGKAEIDGRRYDVVADGEMIESGAAIEVRLAQGNRIVVRRAKKRPEGT